MQVYKNYIAWRKTNVIKTGTSFRGGGGMICFCFDTAASRGAWLDVSPRAWANSLRRLTSHVGGGVALFCCSGEIWHGDERKRGREWDSLIGINGSSEVWTDNVTMGSNDWKQNGKRQMCSYFLHIHRNGLIHGSFDSEHNRLPLQTGAPAFMRVRASMRSTSGSVRIPLF